MSLFSGNTNWILLLGAPGEPDERHVLDVAFGILCLEGRGIRPENISVFIDGSNRPQISNILSIATRHVYRVGTSADFFASLSSNVFEQIVLFVTGHGGVDGIAAPVPIKPFPLFHAFRTAPNLRRAVIYLGQCYAGTFNYMRVAGGNSKELPDLDAPPLIVVGATSLFPSISSSTQEQFLTVPRPWVANLFLLHLFHWIRQPVDVDGDGRFTVMDSFKFAGMMTNDSYKQVKTNQFTAPFKVLERLSQLEAEIRRNPNDGLAILTYNAEIENYRNLLGIQFNHQESWILNSIPAQDLEF